MANKYSGTKTEENLRLPFRVSRKHVTNNTYFASKAKKDGFEQIADLFLKTADNEKEHAKMWFKELNGIGTTAENLVSAARAKILNGQICMPISQKLPKKKALPNWLKSSVW